MLCKRYVRLLAHWRQPLLTISTRNFSEVIDLSPSEASQSNQAIKAKNHPANYAFQKLDFGNTLLSQAVLKVQSKKMRERSGLIMLEGWRLIQEAVDSGCELTSIFFSRPDDLNKLKLPEGSFKIYKTPFNEMKIWSNLTTPPGILAICKKPPPIPETRESLPLTIICDQIREPGNLGSMIRNCAGVGVRRVILTPGCTDLWDSKVLRGGAGSHFKVRIHPDVNWAEIEALVAAENSCLNLATSSSSSSPEGSSFERLLPLIPYWEADFTSKHNFLVIGGETESVSSSAYEVAGRSGGSRLTIPLYNNIDSLNSVSAACVIMFEIRKQLTRSTSCVDERLIQET